VCPLYNPLYHPLTRRWVLVLIPILPQTQRETPRTPGSSSSSSRLPARPVSWDLACGLACLMTQCGRRWQHALTWAPDSSVTTRKRKPPPSQSESAALPLQCQRLAKLTAALAYARRGIYAARQSSPAASWLRPAGRRQRERRARGRWPGQLAPGDDGAAAPPLDRRRPTSCCRLLINDSNRMTAGGGCGSKR
jgi:hypothetical protein